MTTFANISKIIGVPKKMEKLFLSENIRLLREGFGLTQSAFSKIIGKGSSIIGTYESGTSKPPLEILLIISNYFGVDLNSLVSKDLKKFCTFERDHSGNVVMKCGNESGNDTKSKLPLPQKVGEPQASYSGSNSIAVPVLDMKAAAARFGAGYMPNEYDEPKSAITLPTSMVKRGRQYFFIPIEGKSMQPTLLHGDLVLASIIDKSQYASITSGRVYVIATKEDGVVVKRIKNRLTEFGFLRANSDNVMHPGFNIPEENITNVLEIAFKISFDLSNVATSLQGQIDDLADRLEWVEGTLKKPRK